MAIWFSFSFQVKSQRPWGSESLLFRESPSYPSTGPTPGSPSPVVSALAFLSPPVCSTSLPSTQISLNSSICFSVKLSLRPPGDLGCSFSSASMTPYTYLPCAPGLSPPTSSLYQHLPLVNYTFLLNLYLLPLTSLGSRLIY